MNSFAEKKQICILGSTGSIGTQTLNVIKQKKEYYRVVSLTTNNNIKLLESQCAEFMPNTVVIADYAAFNEFKRTTSFKGTILYGNEGLETAASDNRNDLVVSSLVGFSGVLPTLAAIKSGKNIALANKETLVSAGKIIKGAAEQNNIKIFPVDSEHSAIFQCLVGERVDTIDKLILTASGGPFWNLDKKEFKNITKKQALKHPNWTMGSKVTVDSATMMNKGFEVIEAYWLFNISVDRISVLVHPQSIIHSLIKFKDASIKAQLSLPDMRLPISYALSYPERYEYDFPDFDLAQIQTLQFFAPDFEKFPCLDIAYRAIEYGGNSTVIINAANEVAVDAFIKEKLSFIEIPIIIEKAITKFENKIDPDLDEIISLDSEVKKYVHSLF